MDTRADVLWRVNNEYRKRLAQAQTFLDLLEQIVLAQPKVALPLLESLRYARAQMSHLVEEHRDWRHRFYYDSPETRRMVQAERAIIQALARFNRMLSLHQTRLHDLYALLNDLPRPNADLTRVPNGDLWTMTQYAIYDLLEFGDYLEELDRVN